MSRLFLRCLKENLPLKTLDMTESISFAGASQTLPKVPSVAAFFVNISNRSTVAVKVFSSNDRLTFGCDCSLLFLPPNFMNIVFISMLFSIRNELKFLHVSSASQKPLSKRKGTQIFINPPVSGNVFEHPRLLLLTALVTVCCCDLTSFQKTDRRLNFKKKIDIRCTLYAVRCMYIVQKQLVRAFFTRFFAILLVHNRFSV
jgi:hypothetical protein